MNLTAANSYSRVQGMGPPGAIRLILDPGLEDIQPGSTDAGFALHLNYGQNPAFEVGERW